jgi:Bacterial RNA polymerase, alpha chain C terminal domain
MLQSDGLPVDRVEPHVISRYVVWDVMTAQAAEGLTSLPLMIGNLEAVIPTSLPLPTRIALRQFLSFTGAGCELALDKKTQPLRVSPCNRTLLPELGLSARSLHCLATVATLDDLLAWTPNRLRALKNFGAKSFLEVTRLLGEIGYPARDVQSPFGIPTRSSHAGDYPFGCLMAIAVVFPLGSLRRKLERCGWKTIGDLARHPLPEVYRLAALVREEQACVENVVDNLSLRLPIAQPDWVQAHVDDLRRVFASELAALGMVVDVGRKRTVSTSLVFKGSASSLNEELERLIPLDYDQRKRAIVVSLFGLGGDDPRSLAEVSKAQVRPMSRERVRQIGSPFHQAVVAEGRNLLWLRKALAILTEASPCSLEHAQERLAEILVSPLSLASLLKVADRASLDHTLEIHAGLLFDHNTPSQLQSAMENARRICARWGVADWTELGTSSHGRMLAPILPANLVWLGDSERYFAFADGKNSLANRLARILHVSPRIPLEFAYAGVFRDPKVESVRLPRELFSAFCNIWSWCLVEGDTLQAVGALPAVYASVDRLLVSLIRSMGRPVTRQEAVQGAREAGIGEGTLRQSLMYSNVLTESRGLYSVIGDPGIDDLMQAAAKSVDAQTNPK